MPGFLFLRETAFFEKRKPKFTGN